jgi:hypothetical protein
MEIKKRQEYMISVLQARKVEFEEIDISDPTRESDKQFMRENSPPKEGQSVVLPPVIFKSDVYCADYETFLDAVECNTLFELLGIEKA